MFQPPWLVISRYESWCQFAWSALMFLWVGLNVAFDIRQKPLFFADERRIIFAAMMTAMLVHLVVFIRSRAYVKSHTVGRCPRCGYDLQGSPNRGACPECGRFYVRDIAEKMWRRRYYIYRDPPPGESYWED